jgi:sugar lactone lactonase YvrE
MRIPNCIPLSFLSVILLASIGFSQSGIITTYAGPQMPINGDRAIIPDIGQPISVASDGSGGFYFASNITLSTGRVYRVTGDGRLFFVAGNGIQGYSGDGGPATSAQLNHPWCATIDAAGNLFIADSGNRRIRKVTSGGVISTVAGNGTKGYGGDGGPATSASFDGMGGLAIDAAGNLFIADTYNARIRKVTPGGMISTVAGNGIQGYSGDGGPATSAQLNYPLGIAVDTAGILYIADSSNFRVRKVTPDGLISTVAGNGTPGYSGDGGPAASARLGALVSVAVDTAGNLLIAADVIRKVTPDGLISTVAGNGTPGYSGDGGPATSAQIWQPYSVAVDTAGSFFIADLQNARIRKVTPDGVINTVAGSGTQGYRGDDGPATSALLDNPLGITIDAAGNLFIADNGNYRIRKVTSGGVISTVAGNGTKGYSGDGGPATSAQLGYPYGVAVDAAGNLFIADTYNYRIRKVRPGGVISTVAGNGIQGYGGDGGLATSAQLGYPYGVAIDAAGNLFIADTYNARIRKVTPGGVIRTVAGNGIQGYGGDGGPATSVQLNYPLGIAVDTAGILYIADSGNFRIRRVTPDGLISTVAGDGTQSYGGDGGPATSAQLSYPQSVAVDSSGNLFIGDTLNNRIRKMTPDGLISTVAGGAGFGYGGDGGPATSAHLALPSDVAVDIAGNLFISDTENNRIRKVASATACYGLNLNSGGAAICQTTGRNEKTKTGYAQFTVNSGGTPYGTAVFSLKQNGVTVTEAGVPSSPPTTAGRIFIDYRSYVNAIPSRSDSGTININTGIAVANTGAATANVTYTLRNLTGNIISVGHGTIAAGHQFACFIDQLKHQAAPDFDLPSDFQTSTQFGTLEIVSDQPISILALRGANNQRNEFLITTTPAADLRQPASDNSIYFPQLADGGGYTTSLMLINASNRTEKGTLRILDGNGNPLAVNQAGGTRSTSFKYSIPANGAFHFQTDGSPSDINAGWIQLTPDLYNTTPIGSGVFSLNSGNILVSESGIPSAVPTTHARIYVDLSGSHNTGLAIANVSGSNALITINGYQLDGATAAGRSQDPIPLSAKGYKAAFTDQLISGLPEGFVGVLDISSTRPFAALTIRGLTNERDEFLMTTFPVADENRSAPSPVVFPQVADSGGYITEFILISAGQTASTTLGYYDESGMPIVY